MPPEPAVKRAVVFVDGQNLYPAAREAFGYTYPNYDVLTLARTICHEKGWTLTQTRFYTEIPDLDDDARWHGFWSAKLSVMGRQGVHVCHGRWTSHHLSSCFWAAPLGVVEGAAGEHGHEDVEGSISDSAQGPSVFMTGLAEAIIVRSKAWVDLDADPRPVIDGVAQTGVTGQTHADDGFLAALAGHRGRTGVGPQGLVVSLCQGPRGLGEQRGGDESPHSRQGPEDRHVTVLPFDIFLGERGQQRLDSGADGAGALVVDQAQAGQQQGDMRAGGF